MVTIVPLWRRSAPLLALCLLLRPLTPLEAAPSCNETLGELQQLVDQIGAAGGGDVMLPCGRTEISAELVLPSGVRLRGAAGVPGKGCQASTLALCRPNPYIVRFGDGVHLRTGVQGVTFDCRNLLTPAPGNAPGIGRAAVAATSHALSGTEVLISDCAFINIPMADQSYHAIGLANLEATVRNNWVNQSGGDALNFNSGQYIIDGNHVHDVGDGCVALNNNALGVVSNNILQRCNLAIGCGPEGSQRDNNTHPFIISGNLIEDSDYGVLLGWFGFVGGEGPTEVVVTGNDLLRCRTASIRYDGNPNGTDGFLTVAGNRISRAGEFPQQLPPPGSQQPSPNAGNGIVVVGIRDVTVENNVVSDGNGSAIVVQGASIKVTGNRVAQQKKFELPGSIGIALIGEAHAVDVTENSVAGFGTGIDISCPANGVVLSRNTITVTSGGMDAIAVGGAGQIVSEVAIDSNIARNGGVVTLGASVDRRSVVLRNNVFFGARGSQVSCVNITSGTALLADSGNVCTME